VVDDVTRDTLLPIVFANVDRETYIMTDEATQYRGQFRKVFLGHGTVTHGASEYGRGRVQTNTVEGSFSIFNRGMKGMYQHCSEKHLDRYVAEFEFRYNNRSALGVADAERSVRALLGASGKRLTYRRANA
jgi:hypothetical protein